MKVVYNELWARPVKVADQEIVACRYAVSRQAYMLRNRIVPISDSRNQVYNRLLLRKLQKSDKLT